VVPAIAAITLVSLLWSPETKGADLKSIGLV